MDQAHLETDKIIEKIAKRLNREYKTANKDMEKKLEKYLKAFDRKDRAKRDLLKQGLISEQEYKDWRIGQIMIGKRWEEMLDTLAQDYHNTNEIARQIAKDNAYDVYALNHDYGTFQVEKESLVDTSYTLYDRGTVSRLAKADQKMLPDPSERTLKRIRDAKEKRWSKQKLNSAIMQGILQGEPLAKVAKRLQSVTNMEKAQAMRNARTMMTNAQSAGRYDAYRRAKGMGINFKVVWIATLDNRTRHEHRQLDGQMQDVDTPFEVDGQQIMYPADLGGSGYKVPPELIYNCRCTIGVAIPGTKLYEQGLQGVDRFSRLGDMSYEEWKNEHTEAEQKIDAGIIPIKLGNADNLLAEKAQDISEYAKRLDSDSVQKFNKIFGQAEYKAAEDGSYYNPDDKAIYIKPDSSAPHTAFHESIHWMDYHADLQIVDDWGFFENIYDEDFNITGKKWIPKEVVIKEHASFSEKIAWTWGSDFGNGSLATKDLSNFEKICGTSGNYGYGRKDLGDDVRAINAFLKKRGISKSDPDFIHFSDFISAISYDANMGSVITGGHEYDYWTGYNGDEHRIAEITAGYQVLKSLGRNDLLEVERELAPALMNLLDTEWSKLWQKL